MGVLTSHDEARQYAEHDPFVLAGLVEDWHLCEWANIFRSPRGQLKSSADRSSKLYRKRPFVKHSSPFAAPRNLPCAGPSGVSP